MAAVSAHKTLLCTRTSILSVALPCNSSSFGDVDDDDTFDVANKPMNIDAAAAAVATAPPIEDDPGGEYVQGDYDLELDEDLADEVSDMDDLALPDDVGE